MLETTHCMFSSPRPFTNRSCESDCRRKQYCCEADLFLAIVFWFSEFLNSLLVCHNEKRDGNLSVYSVVSSANSSEWPQMSLRVMGQTKGTQKESRDSGLHQGLLTTFLYIVVLPWESQIVFLATETNHALGTYPILQWDFPQSY